MQFSYENQNSSSFLVCELAENEELDTLGMGMLTNNQIPGILPVTFVQMDDKRFLRFNISSKITLSDLFSGSVNRTRLLNVFSSLCEAFSNTGDYLLDNGMFLLDAEHMYADVTTGKTRLVYLPIEREIDEPDITALIKEMMLSVSYDETENTGYIARLMNYLNSVGKVDLKKLAEILQELKVDAFMEGADGVTREAQQSYQQAAQPVQQPVYRQPQQQKAYQQQSMYQQPVQEPSYQQPMPTVHQPSYQQSVQQPIYQDPIQTVQNPIYQGEANQPQLQNRPSFSSGTTVLGKGAFNSLTSEQNSKNVEAKQDAAQEQAAQPEPAAKRRGLFGFARRSDNRAKEAAAVQERQKPAQSSERAGNYGSNLEPRQYVRRQEFNPESNQQPRSVNFNAERMNQGQQMQLRERNDTVALKQVNRQGSGTTILNGGAGGFAGSSGQYVPSLILRRERTGQEMRISKSIFHIGAEQSYADFYIPDNDAISRSHADIIVRGNKYYIKDTNSLNHTYLNGELLTSNMEYPLRSGDTIVLANEPFEFRVK